MSSVHITVRTRKAMADLKQHWIRAASYEVVCARKADRLLAWESWSTNVVLILTTISSLGVFTAIVADNPALWARVVVFVFTAVAAVLTALRQQNDWTAASEALRRRQCGWNRQRALIGDHVQRVLNGEQLDAAQISAVDQAEAALLDGHPAIPTRQYQQVKEVKTRDFERIYEFRTELQVHA